MMQPSGYFISLKISVVLTRLEQTNFLTISDFLLVLCQICYISLCFFGVSFACAHRITELVLAVDLYILCEVSYKIIFFLHCLHFS